jgi:hypothetical protein
MSYSGPHGEGHACVPGGGEARPRGQLIDRRRRGHGDADERYDSQSILQMSPTAWRRARGRHRSTAAPAPPHATGSPQDDQALAKAFPLDAVVDCWRKRSFFWERHER